MRRLLHVFFLGLPLIAASAAHAAPLQGIWKGKLHRRFIYETQTHRAVYAEDLDLTLLVSEKEVSGHGAAHLSNPIVERIRNDRRYAQYQTVYEPQDFGLRVKGARTGDGNWLTFTLVPDSPVKANFHYSDADGSNTRVLLDVPALFSQSIPWTTGTMGHFLRHRHLSPGDGLEVPADLAYFGETVLGAEFETEGGFEKIKTPARKVSSSLMLAALMIYGGLILPGLIQWPGSNYMMCMIGTLMGTLRALEEFGQRDDILFIRSGGLAAVTLILFLEWNRVYKKNSAAGELLRKTSMRLVRSALLDLTAFAVCVWLMDKAMDAAVTSAALFGRMGAATAAVTLAALITYGIAFFTKELSSLGPRIQ